VWLTAAQLPHHRPPVQQGAAFDPAAPTDATDTGTIGVLFKTSRRERIGASGRTTVVGTTTPTNERMTQAMSHDRANTVIPRVPMPPVSGRARARRILRAGLGVMVVAVVASLSSTAYAAGSTVDVATSATFGTVLTASQGFALYTFPSDHNGMSACTGSCVAVWPALTVPAGTTPTAGAGVPGAVASVLQTNGTYQVTYNDAPLYTFVGDTAPGQVSGNNVGGFTVVQIASVSTTPTTSAPAATTGSTSPSTPTSPQASTTPTTPAATSATTPTRAPATVAVSGTSSASVPSSAPAPAASNAPTSLAFTGPGPGLTWMVIAGVVLVATSVTTLLLLGDRNRLPRALLGRALRAGGWLLGR